MVMTRNRWEWKSGRKRRYKYKNARVEAKWARSGTESMIPCVGNVLAGIVCVFVRDAADVVYLDEEWKTAIVFDSLPLGISIIADILIA